MRRKRYMEDRPCSERVGSSRGLLGSISLSLATPTSTAVSDRPFFTNTFPSGWQRFWSGKLQHTVESYLLKGGYVIWIVLSVPSLGSTLPRGMPVKPTRCASTL